MKAYKLSTDHLGRAQVWDVEANAYRQIDLREILWFIHRQTKYSVKSKKKKA